MNAHELLAFTSEVTLAVLGAPGSAGEFVLVDVKRHSDDALAAVVGSATAKRYAYVGTIGFQDGRLTAECEPDPASWFTMVHAGLAASRMLADRLRPPTAPAQGDAVAWLRALAALQDPRTAP